MVYSIGNRRIGRRMGLPAFNLEMGRWAVALAAAAGLCLSLSACGGDDASDPLVVTTDKGTLKGVERSGARHFYGIPYAAAPVGARRWQPPQAAGAWSGERDATKFASHCPQTDSPFSRASGTSEDCLFLNVFRPTGTGPYPVMVWIHGGGLQQGDSDPYDPSQLVAQGVVVVTMNYRLGALGFLAHAALSAEASGSSGNYGLMDQQAALQWVQRNIAAFGGDAGNVTIFGESAGGVSVHSHLAAPSSSGLFHKAIVQSGSYSLNTPSLEAAQSRGQVFAAAAGCADQSASCLRNLSLSTILANQLALLSGTAVQPTVDGRVLPRSHREAFATGNFNRVPVIEGSNSFEHSLVTAVFFDFLPPPLGLGEVTASNYPAALAAVLNFNDTRKTAAQVNAVYPLASFGSAAQAIDQIGTDNGYACSALSTLRMLAAYTTVYQYEFNDPDAPMLFLPPTATHPRYGAYHASELQYLFGLTPPYPLTPAPPALTAAQRSLSEKMISFWAGFARSGNPNGSGSGSGSVVWPVFKNGAEGLLSLEPAGVRVSTSFASEHRCGFWLAP